jgi:hypothetical protein
MITFLRDTREKNGKGWFWSEGKEITGTESARLKYGDYAIKGYEKEIVVERKGSPSELVKNLLSKDRDRFHRELRGLKGYRHAWIVCSFSMSDLVKTFERRHGGDKSHLTTSHLFGAIGSISCRYGVPFFFAGDEDHAGLLCKKLLLAAIRLKQPKE